MTNFENKCAFRRLSAKNDLSYSRSRLRVSGRNFWVVSIVVMAILPSGCAISHKTAVKPSQAPGPLQTATKEQLIERYDLQANAFHSLNASVTMKLTAGSVYTGLIEQYHEVNGFILAQKPASIRLIGQAPVVGKNIFDMVSDGETFHIFIPSKNKFLVGPANLERPAKKPIENLRPQHLIDAMLWSAIPKGTPVLLEEAAEGTSRYYVLTVVRRAGGDSARNARVESNADWEITRKIWFDRADLTVARIETYGLLGNVNSDIRYRDWQPVGETTYPREVALNRPGDDYELQIAIHKLTVNEPVAADGFLLQQPPGTELVNVGDDAKEQQP
jgi:hypothetical protein